MRRIAELEARMRGTAEVVDLRSAWPAACVVTARFPGASTTVVAARLVNWFRLAFVTRAVTNRDRTVVIGVGATRPEAIVVAGLLGAWLAPRLPKWVLLATVGAVVTVAARRGRVARLLWISRTLRREAPDALLVGEFAALEPGAGVAFATELLEAVGAHTTLALTVQGGRDDRHARSLVRLYERRLRFEVVARQAVGHDDLVLMVRRATPQAAAPRLRAVG